MMDTTTAGANATGKKCAEICNFETNAGGVAKVICPPTTTDHGPNGTGSQPHEFEAPKPQEDKNELHFGIPLSATSSTNKMAGRFRNTGTAKVPPPVSGDAGVLPPEDAARSRAPSAARSGPPHVAGSAPPSVPQSTGGLPVGTVPSQFQPAFSPAMAKLSEEVARASEAHTKAAEAQARAYNLMRKAPPDLKAAFRKELEKAQKVTIRAAETLEQAQKALKEREALEMKAQEAQAAPAGGRRGFNRSARDSGDAQKRKGSQPSYATVASKPPSLQVLIARVAIKRAQQPVKPRAEPQPSLPWWKAPLDASLPAGLEDYFAAVLHPEAPNPLAQLEDEIMHGNARPDVQSLMEKLSVPRRPQEVPSLWAHCGVMRQVSAGKFAHSLPFAAYRAARARQLRSKYSDAALDPYSSACLQVLNAFETKLLGFCRQRELVRRTQKIADNCAALARKTNVNEGTLRAEIADEARKLEVNTVACVKALMPMIGGVLTNSAEPIVGANSGAKASGKERQEVLINNSRKATRVLSAAAKPGEVFASALELMSDNPDAAFRLLAASAIGAGANYGDLLCRMCCKRVTAEQVAQYMADHKVSEKKARAELEQVDLSTATSATIEFRPNAHVVNLDTSGKSRYAATQVAIVLMISHVDKYSLDDMYNALIDALEVQCNPRTGLPAGGRTAAANLIALFKEVKDAPDWLVGLIKLATKLHAQDYFCAPFVGIAGAPGAGKTTTIMHSHNNLKAIGVPLKIFTETRAQADRLIEETTKNSRTVTGIMKEQPPLMTLTYSGSGYLGQTAITAEARIHVSTVASAALAAKNGGLSRSVCVLDDCTPLSAYKLVQVAKQWPGEFPVFMHATADPVGAVKMQLGAAVARGGERPHYVIGSSHADRLTGLLTMLSSLPEETLSAAEMDDLMRQLTEEISFIRRKLGLPIQVAYFVNHNIRVTREIYESLRRIGLLEMAGFHVGSGLEAGLGPIKSKEQMCIEIYDLLREKMRTAAPDSCVLLERIQEIEKSLPVNPTPAAVQTAADALERLGLQEVAAKLLTTDPSNILAIKSVFISAVEQQMRAFARLFYMTAVDPGPHKVQGAQVAGALRMSKHWDLLHEWAKNVPVDVRREAAPLMVEALTSETFECGRQLAALLEPYPLYKTLIEVYQGPCWGHNVGLHTICVSSTQASNQPDKLPGFALPQLDPELALLIAQTDDAATLAGLVGQIPAELREQLFGSELRQLVCRNANCRRPTDTCYPMLMGIPTSRHFMGASVTKISIERGDLDRFRVLPSPQPNVTVEEYVAASPFPLLAQNVMKRCGTLEVLNNVLMHGAQHFLNFEQCLSAAQDGAAVRPTRANISDLQTEICSQRPGNVPTLADYLAFYGLKTDNTKMPPTGNLAIPPGATKLFTSTARSVNAAKHDSPIARILSPRSAAIRQNLQSLMRLFEQFFKLYPQHHDALEQAMEHILRQYNARDTTDPKGKEGYPARAELLVVIIEETRRVCADAGVNAALGVLQYFTFRQLFENHAGKIRGDMVWHELMGLFSPYSSSQLADSFAAMLGTVRLSPGKIYDVLCRAIPNFGEIIGVEGKTAKSNKYVLAIKNAHDAWLDNLVLRKSRVVESRFDDEDARRIDESPAEQVWRQMQADYPDLCAQLPTYERACNTYGEELMQKFTTIMSAQLFGVNMTPFQIPLEKLNRLDNEESELYHLSGALGCGSAYGLTQTHETAPAKSAAAASAPKRDNRGVAPDWRRYLMWQMILAEEAGVSRKALEKNLERFLIASYCWRLTRSMKSKISPQFVVWCQQNLAEATGLPQMARAIRENSRFMALLGPLIWNHIESAHGTNAAKLAYPTCKRLLLTNLLMHSSVGTFERMLNRMDSFPLLGLVPSDFPHAALLEIDYSVVAGHMLDLFRLQCMKADGGVNSPDDYWVAVPPPGKVVPAPGPNLCGVWAGDSARTIILGLSSEVRKEAGALAAHGLTTKKQLTLDLMSEVRDLLADRPRAMVTPLPPFVRDVADAFMGEMISKQTILRRTMKHPQAKIPDDEVQQCTEQLVVSIVALLMAPPKTHPDDVQAATANPEIKATVEYLLSLFCGCFVPDFSGVPAAVIPLNDPTLERLANTAYTLWCNEGCNPELWKMSEGFWEEMRYVLQELEELLHEHRAQEIAAEKAAAAAAAAEEAAAAAAAAAAQTTAAEAIAQLMPSWSKRPSKRAAKIPAAESSAAPHVVT